MGLTTFALLVLSFVKTFVLFACVGQSWLLPKGPMFVFKNRVLQLVYVNMSQSIYVALCYKKCFMQDDCLRHRQEHWKSFLMSRYCKSTMKHSKLLAVCISYWSLTHLQVHPKLNKWQVSCCPAQWERGDLARWFLFLLSWRRATL